MARARNIKPALFKNEVLGMADPLYTILFEGLWVLADREGRLEDRPMRIKAEVLPYRDGIDMEAMLNWLVRHAFIQRYKAAGVALIQIVNFTKHQNPHKNEAPSEHPAPSDEIGSATENAGSARADSLYSDSLYSDSLNQSSASQGGTPPLIPEQIDRPALWAEIKGQLVRAGVAKASAGGIIKDLIGKFTEPIVIEAMQSCVRDPPGDIREYLPATCQHLAGLRRPLNKQEALEQRNRAIAEEWAAEGGGNAAN